MEIILFLVSTFLIPACVGYFINRAFVPLLPSTIGRAFAAATVRGFFYTPTMIVGHGGGPIVPSVLVLATLFTGEFGRALPFLMPAAAVFLVSLAFAGFGIGLIPPDAKPEEQRGAKQ